MMTREALEKYQVLIYLAAILLGLMVGTASPRIGAALEGALWPILAALLYATFAQVPLLDLRSAFLDGRFLATAVVGNFLVLPVVVWGLLAFVPDEPAIQLGVALVLLVPCTDWFITFAQLSGGDVKRAIAFTPISLLLQLVLLPAYLWILFDAELALAFAHGEMLLVFAGLILAPLLAAALTERWAKARRERSVVLERLAWLPVPLLAIVVLTVAASQVSIVWESGALLGRLLPVFVGFLVLAGVLALVLARFVGLPAAQGRTLAFSFGTRNSFVVLPLAIVLPGPFELAAVVIVFQTLIELFGMVAFLWWVPRKLFPA